MPENDSNINQILTEPVKIPIAQKAARLGIPIEGKSDQQLTSEIIEFRQHQNRESRACEYVTGMLPENPMLLDKFIEDQLIIRQKYGLPSIAVFQHNPVEYERIIREIAKKNGIAILPTSECGDYFEKFPKVGAVTINHIRNNIIGVDIKRNNGLKQYKDSLLYLEHEFVHAMQNIRYQSLTPELVEYEVYIIGYDIDQMKKLSSDDIAFIVFGYLFQGSVRRLYKQIHKKPPWDNPKWFLKNIDGIDVPKPGFKIK